MKLFRTLLAGLMIVAAMPAHGTWQDLKNYVHANCAVNEKTKILLTGAAIGCSAALIGAAATVMAQKLGTQSLVKISYPVPMPVPVRPEGPWWVWYLYWSIGLPAAALFGYAASAV